MWALGILSERLAERLTAHELDPENNPPVSDNDLWRLAEAGQKMAGVVARSKVPISTPNLEGFRAGAGGLPSPRMSGHRIRSVDGERRPVRDEGYADREEYNRKARERGGETL